MPFVSLVEQYQRLLFGTAYLILKDGASAEEAVQETLVKMWKHLPSLRNSCSIKEWLIRIVVNESKTAAKKNEICYCPT
jgi:RNA polymerase sigma-70 factor (ECF subfamily)